MSFQALFRLEVTGRLDEHFEKKKFLNVCFLCFLTSSPYEILTVLILYSPLTIHHLTSYIYFPFALTAYLFVAVFRVGLVQWIDQRCMR